MANEMVTQLFDLINQQIIFQESLGEHVAKAEALVHVAMSDFF